MFSARFVSVRLKNVVQVLPPSPEIHPPVGVIRLFVPNLIAPNAYEPLTPGQDVSSGPMVLEAIIFPNGSVTSPAV